MTRSAALAVCLALTLALSACGRGPGDQATQSNLYPGETPEMRALIEEYADLYDMPQSLLHRVIQRESGYNASARNGPYYGLLQILPQTAGTMGFNGPASALLDAETNLKYAGKYLAGAWLVSGGDQDEAVHWYASGYYYEAKRLGLLEETGLRS